MAEKTPPKKAKPKPDTRSQSQRFIDFAEKHGATDPGALDRVMDAGDLKKKPKD